MSHFTSVKVKVSDLDALCEALEGLPGVERVEKDATVRGYAGATRQSQVVAVMEGRYDVGFDLDAKNEGEIVITADWWGLNTSEATFADKVMQQYTKVEASNRLEIEGFSLEETMEDGKIVLTATRWV